MSSRVVDAQLHTWAADSPKFPWNPEYGRVDAIEARNRAHNASAPMTYDRLIEIMDAHGVDAALITSTAVYGIDNRYSLQAARDYPGRFAVVGRVDPLGPDIEERLQGWREQPAMVGLRLVVVSERERANFRDGLLMPVFRSAGRHGVPVCMFPPGLLLELPAVMEEAPELKLVIDHLGLAQPPLMTADPDPFQRINELISLAKYPNVFVKATGVPTLSHQGYPFADVRLHLRRVIDAFGPGRVMWGTDYTRTSGLHSYAEAIGYLREAPDLPQLELEMILGGTADRIFGLRAAGI